MFTIIFSAALVLIHVYFWKRLVKDTTGPGRNRWLLTGLLAVGPALLIAALNLPKLVGIETAAWVSWGGFIWMAVVLYLFLALLVLEPVRLALRSWVKGRPRETVSQVSGGPPEIPDDASSRPDVIDESTADTASLNRRLFLARASALAAGAASVGIVGVGASTALGPPDVLQVPIRLRRLDPAFNGFRVAVVSDIHLGPLLGRAHTDRIVRMINESEPDLVAIVGDLVDASVAELGHAAAPLQDLVAREGSFFVTGNHEYVVDDTLEWLDELERLGVHTLRNENTRIRRGAASFDLAGVNDVSGRRRSDPPDFDRALAGVSTSGPTVLMAHQPVQVGEAAARGVDLQLSGHTHGGQLWPFQYLVESMQPSLAGLSTVDDTQLYVSRGVGFWGPPVRIGARPDITVLSLQAGV
ncbi:metallophosphoesterase [soil metagenome]